MATPTFLHTCIHPTVIHNKLIDRESCYLLPESTWCEWTLAFYESLDRIYAQSELKLVYPTLIGVETMFLDCPHLQSKIIGNGVCP